LSDCIDILKDIITEFKGHPYYVNSQLNIIDDINFEAFTEEFDEEVSGWVCEISLMTPVLTSFCGIPSADITGFEFPGADCPDVNVLCPVFVEDVTGVYPIVVTTTGTTKEVSIVGSGLSDTFVISGEYDNGTLTLTRNDDVDVVVTGFDTGGSGGFTGTFTNGDGDTVTVTNGLITAIEEAIALLLDNLTGSTGAFSLRKLKSSYNGSAIQVRRVSDNTTQDIGFINNQLDIASLNSFCSGTDGFVTIWYNQSDSGANAIQTTSSNQPKIYDSSTGIQLENGKPCILFNNSNDNFLEVIDTTFGNIQDAISNFSVFKLDNNSAFFPTLFSKSYSEDGAVVVNGEHPIRNLKFWFDNDNVTSSYDISNKHTLVSNFANSGTNGIKVYANSILKVEKTTSQDLTGTNTYKFSIGRNNRDNSYYWNGTIQEILLFSSNQTTNKTTIEDDINTNYSIY